MTEKELKEAPEAPDELADTEIEEATGGLAPKAGNIYGGPGGVKFD